MTLFNTYFKRNTGRKLKAMTLPELLIVLVIIGILVSMAYPIFAPLFQKTRSTEAKIQLKHLNTLQKVYFLEHSRYGSELKDVGYEQAELVGDDGDGGTAQYRVEIVEAGVDNFTGRATAITDFDGDGIYNVWEINKSGVAREIVED